MTDERPGGIVGLLSEYDQITAEFRRAARIARDTHQAAKEASRIAHEAARVAREAYQKARDLELQVAAKRQAIIDCKTVCQWDVSVESVDETIQAAKLETVNGGAT